MIEVARDEARGYLERGLATGGEAWEPLRRTAGAGSSTRRAPWSTRDERREG